MKLQICLHPKFGVKCFYHCIVSLILNLQASRSVGVLNKKKKKNQIQLYWFSEMMNIEHCNKLWRKH